MSQDINNIQDKVNENSDKLDELMKAFNRNMEYLEKIAQSLVNVGNHLGEQNKQQYEVNKNFMRLVSNIVSGFAILCTHYPTHTHDEFFEDIFNDENNKDNLN